MKPHFLPIVKMNYNGEYMSGLQKVREPEAPRYFWHSMHDSLEEAMDVAVAEAQEANANQEKATKHKHDGIYDASTDNKIS